MISASKLISIAKKVSKTAMLLSTPAGIGVVASAATIFGAGVLIEKLMVGDRLEKANQTEDLENQLEDLQKQVTDLKKELAEFKTNKEETKQATLNEKSLAKNNTKEEVPSQTSQATQSEREENPLPPFTIIDNGKMIIFNSKADSTEYAQICERYSEDLADVSDEKIQRLKEAGDKSFNAFKELEEKVSNLSQQSKIAYKEGNPVAAAACEDSIGSIYPKMRQITKDLDAARLAIIQESDLKEVAIREERNVALDDAIKRLKPTMWEYNHGWVPSPLPDDK